MMMTTKQKNRDSLYCVLLVLVLLSPVLIGKDTALRLIAAIFMGAFIKSMFDYYYIKPRKDREANKLRQEPTL